MRNGGRGWEGIPPVADVLFQLPLPRKPTRVFADATDHFWKHMRQWTKPTDIKSVIIWII